MKSDETSGLDGDRKKQVAIGPVMTKGTDGRTAMDIRGSYNLTLSTMHSAG